MRVERLLSSDLIASFIDQIRSAQTTANWKSDRLSHTAIATPQAKAMFLEVGKLATPKLAEFGELLFGEKLQWLIKEIWVNLLEAGGRQAVHSHANRFISGVLHLTHSHPSPHIRLHKSLGGTDFTFSNHNKNARIGPFNGGKSAADLGPSPGRGDAAPLGQRAARLCDRKHRDVLVLEPRLMRSLRPFGSTFEFTRGT